MLGMIGPLYILRSHRFQFPNTCSIVYLSMKMAFGLTNGVVSSGSSLFANSMEDESYNKTSMASKSKKKASDTDFRHGLRTRSKLLNNLNLILLSSLYHPKHLMYLDFLFIQKEWIFRTRNFGTIAYILLCEQGRLSLV